MRIAVSCACAFGSPPFRGGHATGGGVPVAPVGAGLGLGEGMGDGLGDGRTRLGLALGTAVAALVDRGDGTGLVTGAQATTAATDNGVIRRRRERLGTFVV